MITDGNASSEACPLNKRMVLITGMRYDNGWQCVIRSLSVKQTHGTYYMDAL